MKEHRGYFLRTREQVIPGILKLFDTYNIHATWATVGLLFHHTQREMQNTIPIKKPAYKLPNLSAYHYIEHEGIGDSEKDDPLHFGASLVKKIASVPHQEIGTHSYSHYFCNEPGQTPEQFGADLQAAKKAAKPINVSLNSLVFPRNQFNSAYLDVCKQEGIKSVRTNPTDWFWNIKSTQRESKWLRLFRGLDAYVPSGNKKSYMVTQMSMQEGVLLQPASRLLRPWRAKWKLLNRLKLRRIFKEMSQAAKAGEVYHLWWHPHNFGWHPEQNLKELEAILKHFAKLQVQYDMQSKTMDEVVNDYNLLNDSTNKRFNN